MSSAWAGQGQNCADMSLIIPQIFVEFIMCSKHCSRYWETKQKDSYREERKKVCLHEAYILIGIKCVTCQGMRKKHRGN